MDVHHIGFSDRKYVFGTCRLRRPIDGSRVISSNFRFLFFIKRRHGLPVTLPETIVRRRCAALIPFAGNARTHGDQQVAQIAASIREFGFTNPVLIDEEDGIIAGAGRVLGAHLLGLDEVPCIVLAHLTPAQRRAYVLADKKLALTPAGISRCSRSKLASWAKWGGRRRDHRR